MALDWFILERGAHEPPRRRKGRFQARRVARDPDAHFAMEEDTHTALMSRHGQRPFLRRAADYYQDTQYAPDEVGGLLDELASAGPNEEMTAGLKALCEEALLRGCGLVAVAD